MSRIQYWKRQPQTHELGMSETSLLKDKWAPSCFPVMLLQRL